MAAVSQLAEFARRFRNRPAPGVEIVDTPRYQLQLVPDFPIPGPNHASWIRCQAGEVDDVVQEVRATFRARGLPFKWILDPDAEPADLAERLATHGIAPDPHDPDAAVMVLAASAEVDAQAVEGLEIRDGLADYESFAAGIAAANEAFGGEEPGSAEEVDALRRRRYEHFLATAGRRFVLATVHGEPAGSASLTLHPPDGALMNGGAVRPKFRGRGVYRAMVAARLRMIRESGATGAVVWGGGMSRPVLEKLGFEIVSWRRFYSDRQ